MGILINGIKMGELPTVFDPPFGGCVKYFLTDRLRWQGIIIIRMMTSSQFLPKIIVTKKLGCFVAGDLLAIGYREDGRGVDTVGERKYAFHHHALGA